MKYKSILKNIIQKMRQRGNEKTVHYVQFSNGDTFLKSMEKTKYHIVILDIEMPGKNGIEIKELLRNEEGIYILFLTGYGHFMSSAFGKNVCGFLEKPVNEEKLRFYLDKIQDYEKEEIVLYLKESQRSICASEILYIRADNQYSNIYTNKGECIITRNYITDLEQKLDGADFVRTHRTFLVNLEHVKMIKGGIILKNEEKIKIARGKENEIKSKFFDYISKKGRYV